MMPLDSLTLKTYRTYFGNKIAILFDLVQKFLVKDMFCKRVANVTCSHMSHVQITQDVFNLLTGLYSSYTVLESGIILPISNRDMAQNVILQRS